MGTALGEKRSHRPLARLGLLLDAALQSCSKSWPALPLLVQTLLDFHLNSDSIGMYLYHLYLYKVDILHLLNQRFP